MPYFEALKSSACDPKIWSMPVAPGLVHPLLGQVPLQMEQPSPTLPLLFPLFWKMTTHSQLFQNTEAVPTPRHIISQGFFFSSFPPFFEKQASSVVHRPTGILGKYSASYPLCMASVLHAVGHISNFRPFSSSSCGPSPARLSRRLPRLPHLSIIWYGLRMTGRGARAATGGWWDSEYSCWKLSGSCQLIP